MYHLTNMAAHHVQQQLEQIIDEKEEASGVLVRMAGRGWDREPVLRAASYRMAERTLLTSPRDLLPAPVRTEQPGTLSTPGQEPAGPMAPGDAPGPDRLKSYSEEALQPLMNAQPVSRHDDRASKGVVAKFWTANTLLLELSRDELAQLVQDVPEIEDLYPNRRLQVPRVIEARSLPQNVADNRVSAWGLHAIGALAVWGAFGARGNGVKVGVLDTGVDPDHPDLSGKIADWAEFDSSGQPVEGSQPHDTDRHGTHVTGTIVGGDASGQWIGVAPEAEIAAAMVIDGQRGGTDAQVLAGLDWAFERGVDVINMSLGGLTIGPEAPSIYSEAILTFIRAGIPVVTAIGNEGSQTTGSPGNDILAFAVGATTPEDRVAGFSGGRTQIIRESSFIPPEFLPLPYSKPEISAPGVVVRSSVPGAEWAFLNGTSMATPHVAGAIALLLSATRIQSEVEAGEKAFLIQDLLAGSVEELGEAGQDHRFGFGRLDILRAVGFAREEPT